MAFQLLFPQKVLHELTKTHDPNDSDTDDHGRDSYKLSSPQDRSYTLIHTHRNSQVTRPQAVPTKFDSDSDTSDSDIDRVHISSSIARPISSCGYYDDSESDSEQETSKTQLTPCFPTTPALKDGRPHLIVDCEGGGNDGADWRDHVPGTPAIQKDDFHWDDRGHSHLFHSSSDMGNGVDDYESSEVDQDDWPDEMDSDDFPVLHTWTHSWIWHPASGLSSPYLPSILFEPVESQPPDQTSWTPLQDCRYGSRLTVPDHLAFNVRYPPMALSHPVDCEPIGPTTTPVPYLHGFDMPFVYDSSTGHSLVAVMSLRDQAYEGVYSPPLAKRRRRSKNVAAYPSGGCHSTSDGDGETFIYSGLSGLGVFVPESPGNSTS